MKYLFFYFLLLPISVNAAQELTLNNINKYDFKEASKAVCKSEWATGRKPNWRMYDSCLGDKINSVGNVLLSVKLNKGKEYYKKISFPYCVKEWTKKGFIDANMLRSCLEDEANGYLDVKYYMDNNKQYKALLQKVLDESLRSYGCYNMAAYTLENLLEDGSY